MRCWLALLMKGMNEHREKSDKQGDVEEGALQQPQAAPRGRRLPVQLELKGEASSLLAAMEGLGSFEVEHAVDLATAWKKLHEKEKEKEKKSSQKKDKKKNKKKTKTMKEGEEGTSADALPYYSVVVTKLGGRSNGSNALAVGGSGQAGERTFIAVHSWTAANSAHTRLTCFDKGANMVTASTSDLQCK
ncbi:Hydrolase, NUDIX domain containing protein [Balamuthia mandrillaris]